MGRVESLLGPAFFVWVAGQPRQPQELLCFLGFLGISETMKKLRRNISPPLGCHELEGNASGVSKEAEVGGWRKSYSTSPREEGTVNRHQRTPGVACVYSSQPGLKQALGRGSAQRRPHQQRTNGWPSEPMDFQRKGQRKPRSGTGAPLWSSFRQGQREGI